MEKLCLQRSISKIELTKIRSEIKPNICESEIKLESPDELIKVIKFLTVKISIYLPKG